MVVVMLALSSAPAVAGNDELTPDLVGRAEAMLRQHDPRRARDGEVRSVQIEGRDLNLMASYLANRLGAAMHVSVGDHQALVHASVPVVRNPLGSYLNIEAVVRESTGVPRLTQVRVGRVPLPDRVANWAARSYLRRLSHQDGQQLAADMIRSVSMSDGRLGIEYEWRDDATDRMRAMAVSAADEARLRAYHERIVQVMDGLPSSRRSLVELLGPVMHLARERSTGGVDAAVENRSALIALAFYVNGVGMGAVVPDGDRWPRPRRRALLLLGRNDLTKHFLVSAVLTATAGTPLSTVVGVYKEINDAQGGSGFSFSDIAADRAGTAFGNLAVAAPDRLQSRIDQTLSETDLMPDVSGLADNLPGAEFTRRFGGVNTPAYAAVITEIDRRLGECRLYR